MYLNAFLLAIRAIKRNIMRSILTVLGIVIGVASVIAMVMLGDGTTAYVTQNISKLGSNMLIVLPGQDRHGPSSQSLTAPLFKMSDVEAIKREIYGIRAVAPVTSKGVNAVYGNKNYSTSINGSNNEYFIVKDWGFSDGRNFYQNELKSGKAVCVIGETIQKELFGDENSLGQKIRLEKFSCQVIGVLNPKGASNFGTDQDSIIIVPLKMFQRRISGTQDITMMQVSANDNVSTTQVKEELIRLFKERRNIRQGVEDDFYVRDMKDIIATVSSTTNMLTLLLGAVAAISLLVGGIGIMNIMLVSVTERTREIGIRLAIGALEREVLLQFLIEAIVLSSMGGIIGIALGIGIAAVATVMFEIPFIFNQNIIFIAFLFSTLVGIVFGYFPAKKAAKLDPIEALRHE
ncbi:MAG: FtsX-like permease family protein [Sulfurimonas sp.]|jgi:putative ABC transport system permease protein|nr:FtsX-like permease family protein [Sulfurimonas sp.]MBU1216734.1 ABC transporter permease [bacterium]MBU1434861.1 ABC transporter permease [bacterium]MBU1503966.1 ABC transporter permease [bacterium]MBU3938681.1 ABC transporter permease [bacterium]